MEWRMRPEWREFEDAYDAGDEARILELMKAQPELGRFFHPHTTSAMGWAARNGATNLLAALIRDGALERERVREDPASDSSLGVAAESGWSWGVRMLLEAGADTEMARFHRGSPLARAVNDWNNNRSVGGPFNSKLPAAPRSERIEVIRLLLAAGVNLFSGRVMNDARHIFHYLPWHPMEASSLGMELPDLLLTNAIPARQTNANGDTLLHLAAWIGATNAMEELVRRGMEVGATNRAGLTPLHWVAEAGPVVDTGGSLVTWAPEWFAWTTSAQFRPEVRAAAAARLLELGARHDVFTAAGLGNLRALREWLSVHPAGVKARDARGRTALHWAALADSVRSIEFLVREGADLGASDADGNTPLHLALVRWPSAAAAALADLKAPLDRTNAVGLTPLGQAAYSAGAVNHLLGKGAAVNPEAGEPPLFRAMEPALHMAIQRSFVPSMMLQRGSSFPMAAMSPTELAIVSQLLEAGASVHVRNAEGKSPLEKACDAGALNLTELLVRHGARLDGTNAQGAPVWFGFLGKPPMLPYFDSPTWKYQMAATMPRPVQGVMEKAGVMPAGPGIRPISTLEFLTRLGATLNATNAAGQNALHMLAAQSDSYYRSGGMVLIGPDGNPMGGSRPGTVEPGARRIATLREAGLSLESRDRDGNTPWLLACRSMDLELAKLLAKAGANVQATNAEGRNALHLICLPAEPQGGVGGFSMPGFPRFVGPLVPQLIKQGVDPRARDVRGVTPLHYAIAPHNPAFVAVELVEGGADPGAKDNFGVSPIDLAKEANREDLLPFLRDPLGANPFRLPLPQNLPE